MWKGGLGQLGGMEVRGGEGGQGEGTRGGEEVKLG
jgi:hypothetical protein